MHEVELRIELLSSVAISARGATRGDHQTLRFIPGGAILGACAQVLYAAPGIDPARLFHSNAVRFGCGLPTRDGRRTLPVPRSFHLPKYPPSGEEASGAPAWWSPSGDDRIGRQVVNLAAMERPSGEKLGPYRGPAFLDPDLCRVEPEVHFSMRTAIGAGGRVREGYLFTVEAMAPGERFSARLRAREREDLDRLCEVLNGRTIRLGRSRNAEFGEAKVEAQPSPRSWEFSFDSGKAEIVRILLLTDLVLTDPYGQPRLDPLPEDFGLAGFAFVPDSSFIEYRRYSPFNAARRRPDLERHLLAMGSVLTFRSTSGPPVDLDELRSRLSGGVGLFRNEGLGEVLVNPSLLGCPRPFEQARARSAQRIQAPPPDDALALWLLGRAKAERAIALRGKRVDELVGRFRKAPIAPAQWGELRALAVAAERGGKSGSQFLAEVRTMTSQGVGSLQSRWGRKIGGGTLGQELVRSLSRDEDGAVFVAMELSSRMMRERPRG